MRNSAKGVLAAGAAVALLVGGGGTLAFWSDSETIAGDSFSSGELKLGAPDCTGWMLDGGSPYTTQLLVPGDTLTQSCEMDLTATGEHIGADLALSAPEWASTNLLTTDLDLSSSFTVNGAPKTTISEADAGVDAVVATVSVSFTGADAVNDSQALSALLDDLTFSAQQTHVP